MKKVFIAMSGGVDSSVAAALLKDQGYDVTGVFMKFWSPNFASASGGASLGEPDDNQSSFCLWKKEREDALRVAAIIDIPLLTWDFTKEYESKVVDYMIDAYKQGITPNPDLMCNKEIKFGMFFNKALAEGADLIATGHYAQIRIKNQELRIKGSCHSCESRNLKIPDLVRDDSHNGYELLKAKDLNKDQSYFLYTLNQKHLSKTLFPIGKYTKPQVRELAKKFGLPTAEKKDSQGVCFIGPLKVREFLKERIKPKKGSIVKISKSAPKGSLRLHQLISKSVIKSDPLVFGTHDGVYYYTIGQRHGMDIKNGGGPYFVTRKDVKKNILYVGEEKDLYSDTAIVPNVTWVGAMPILPAEIGVKIRYRSESIPCVLENNEAIEQLNNDGLCTAESERYNHSLKLRFHKRARAITPGQAAVFYDDDKVLGGGTII